MKAQRQDKTVGFVDRPIRDSPPAVAIGRDKAGTVAGGSQVDGLPPAYS